MSFFRLIAFLLAAGAFHAHGQDVGIGTDSPNTQSIMEISSNSKGLLIPRISTTDRDNNITGLDATDEGLLIYNTTDSEFNYWDGTQWIAFPAAGSLGDHDWYEEGTTTAPDDINDNQYTFGRVGIGMNTPLYALDIAGDLRIDGSGQHNIYGGPIGSIFMNSYSGISMDLETDGGNTGYFRVRDASDQILFRVNHNGDGILDGDFTLESGGNEIEFAGTDNFVDIYTNTADIGTSLDIESQGSIDMVLDRDNNNPSMEFTIKRNGDGIAAVNKLFSVPEDFSPLVYPYGTLTGNTGGIRFRELEANGSNYIGLRAPDALSASVQLTLPNSAGVNTYLLQTDGSGILSWVDPSTLPGGGGPDADWSISGNDVYKSVGTASIGTASIVGYPLNVVNNDTYRIGINLTQTYTGSSESQGINIINNNNAASGTSIIRGTYSQAEKLGTSGSTGEVHGGYFWGINRYTGASFSNSFGIYALGHKYTGTTGDAYGIWADAFNESGTAGYGIFATAAGGAGTLWAGFFAGNVFTTGGYLPSDRLLKKNIQPGKSSLDRLLRLPVATYQYATEKFQHLHLPEGLQTGFIADEMQTLFPELMKEAILPSPSDEMVKAGGATPSDPVEFQSINYTGLVPHLVKALQEQQELIDALEERLRQLEEKQ